MDDVPFLMYLMFLMINFPNEQHAGATRPVYQIVLKGISTNLVLL